MQGEGAMIVCQEILARAHDVTSQTEIYTFCFHGFFCWYLRQCYSCTAL